MEIQEKRRGTRLVIKSIAQKITEHIGHPILLLLGAVLFFSTAHHAFNFWERSAVTMLGMFIIGTPFLGFVVTFLWRRTVPHLYSIERKRLYLFIIPTLLVSIFIATRVYRVPESYHFLTVSPAASGEEIIGLLEVKTSGVVVDVKKNALESNWSEADHVLYASKDSTPFTVSFKSSVDQPVTVLFQASPQSGKVYISLDNKSIETDLYSSINENNLVELQPKYRGIPNWLFAPALFLIDAATFGLMIMFLLVMQDLGERETALHPKEKQRAHRKYLLVLILLGIIVHVLNALAVPLFLGPDSLSFLEGSVHLLKYGDLNGVSSIRGPGTTFFFAPIMVVFGRNGWGVKIMLHLIAIACIPVSYRVGWQVSKKQSVALISGLLAVLSPDLLFYSNYIMSDVPNIFIVLTFITVLLSALNGTDKRWILSTMLVGSFAILWRSENIVMLTFGVLALAGSAVLGQINSGRPARKYLIYLGMSLFAALLPILWWSGHNLRVHGFFGMSNYQGEVFYDGWIYFGDASNLSFSDPNSAAVQAINDVMKKYEVIVTDKSGVPTGWELYPAMLEAGYTPKQTFDLMASAARDSIMRNKETAIKLLFMKYNDGLTPEITHNITYPLPDEPPRVDSYKIDYFDEETLSIPALIRLQRQINTWTMTFYPRIYPTWVLFCILTIFLSLFRSPLDKWIALTCITASRIFIPLTLGVAFWRYTLAGWIPAQIIAISWMGIFFSGVRVLFQKKDT
ncbi:MAG: hypothetical protein RL226_2282, partial [Bacteroidota bacterium]